VLLSFINDHGRSRRRLFDLATGREIGDILEREGEYRLAFPEDLSDSIRLNGNWTEAELDEWGKELPTTILDALHRDLDLARAEAGGTHSHPDAETLSSEHTAAS
jgi:hypothetical protein